MIHDAAFQFLLWAVEHNNFEAVDKLLASRVVEVNGSGKCTGSPLQIAVIRNNDKMVELLLTKGANANILDIEGQNILYYATGSSENATKLADPCSVSKNLNILKLILNHVPIDSEDYGKYLPYENAVRCGNLSAIDFLLENGLQQNALANRLPLHRTLFIENNIQVLDHLLSKKIFDVNEINHLGFTPLYIAVSGRNYDAVVRLIKAGANFKIPCLEIDHFDPSNVCRRTILSKAMLIGRLNKMSKAPVKTVSYFVGNHEIVSLLFSLGAELNTSDVLKACQILLKLCRGYDFTVSDGFFNDNDNISSQEQQAHKIIILVVGQMALMRKQGRQINGEFEQLLTEE